MNPQPVERTADETAESVRHMQEFKAMLQVGMSEADYMALTTPYKGILEKVMLQKLMLPIEACDVIVSQLDANLALDEEDRELQKALYMIVACDMMGQEFINSLTQ